MKKFLIYYFLITTHCSLFSQGTMKIGNNHTTVNTNALLELEATNKGLLFPRIALNHVDSASPLSAHIQGMTIYNTTTNTSVSAGIYVNNGTKWVQATSSNTWTSYGTNQYSAVSGNVGIGATSVNAKLVVSDSSSSVGILKMQNKNNQGGDKFWIGFSHGTNNSDSQDRARIGVDIKAGGSGRLYFTTGSYNNGQSERMRIDESGYVGIGTTTPSDKLHIVGNARIDAGRLNFANTGSSIFIGNNTGLNDDLVGNYNTFVGESAGYNNKSGEFNVSLGYKSLYKNTSGTSNITIGYNALENDTIGNENISIGGWSLNSVKNGSQNTALGYSTGFENTGSGNLFLGYKAGYNETGSNKLYIDNSNTSAPLIYGDFSNNSVQINDSLKTKHFKLTNGASSGYVLQSDASGNASWVNPTTLTTANTWTNSGTNQYSSNTGNIGIGTSSPSDKVHIIGSLRIDNGRLTYANTGSSVFVGNNAGLSDDHTSNQNVFVGENAGTSNTTGQYNTATGTNSLKFKTSGEYNSSFGYNSLYANTNGEKNTAIGGFALYSNDTGTNNAALGYAAGLFNKGDGNVFLGNGAGYNETGSNTLYIDNTSSTSPLIYGDFTNNSIQINDSLKTKYFKMSNGASNGYYLKSDANGNASWASISGTTGVVAGDGLSFSGTTLNSLWKDGGTSQTYTLDYVGFGTTNPSYGVHVYRSDLKHMQLYGTGTSGTELSLINVSGNGKDWKLTSTGSAHTSGAGNLYFSATNQSGNMVLTPDFKLGIGLTAPTAAIQTYTTDFAVGRFGGTSAVGSWMTIENNSTGGGLWNLISTGSANSEGAGNLLFNDNTNTRMFLKASNGYIGIGASTPLYHLDVNGSGTDIFRAKSAATGGTKSIFENTSTGGSAWNLISTGSGSSQGAGRLVFTDGADNVLTLHASNRVGINSTTPTATLDVYDDQLSVVDVRGAHTSGTNLSIVNSSTGGLAFDFTSTGSSSSEGVGKLLFKGNASTIMTLDASNKRLGIGTTSPSYPFHLSGTSTNMAQITSSNTAGTWSNIENSSTGGTTWNLVSTGSTNGEGAGNLLIRGNGGTKMIVKSADGKVGIGTTSPTSHLEVSSTADDMMKVTSSNTNETNLILNNSSSGGTPYSFVSTGSASSYGVGNFVLERYGVNMMFFQKSNDFVGLGHSSPEAKLQIYSPRKNTLYLDTDNDTANIFSMKSYSNGINWDLIATNTLHSSGTNKFTIQSNSTDRFTIQNSNGFIGVANNAPTHQFDINSTSGLTFRTKSNNTSGTWSVLENTSTGGLAWNFISTGSGNSEGVGNFILRDNSSAKMLIQSATGYIGIGTTSPSAMLHTSGTAQYGFKSTTSNTIGNWLSLTNSSSGGTTWNLVSTGSANGEGAGNFLVVDNTSVRMTILSATGNTGIGTTAPGSCLDVNGAVAFKVKTAQVAGTNTPDNTGEIWFYETGTGTITLPSATTCPNRMYTIVNQTGASRTTSSYKDMTGTSVTSLANASSITIVSDGSLWRQIK